MEAKDLRIGNLVGITTDFSNGRNYYEVLSLGQFAAGLNGQSNYEYEELAPIPLTEEWLIKAGFTRGYSGWQLFANDTYINVSEDYIFFICNEDVIKLNYVHQLQNIVYACHNYELVFTSL